jgi:ribosome-associated protein
MSVDYIENEVKNILDEKEFPMNLAMASSWILGNFKATNLKVLDLTNESALSDYFVLGTATNTVQAQAMAESIVAQLKNHGHQSYSKEGLAGSDWILLDLGDIIVHIFVGSARELYDLDGLWNNCPLIEIPQEYYYADSATEAVESSKGYF